MQDFNKTRRLRTKADYDYVFANASKLVNAEFTVLFRPNRTTQARLGLALSKKVISRAHDRNRIKRVLRESFRKTTNLNYVDVIFLAKRGIVSVENSVLFANLSKIWDKLIAT